MKSHLGVVLTDPTTIKDEARYFSTICFHLEVHHRWKMSCIHPHIIPAMVVDLLHPYTAEEVKVALFQMHPNKSLGPDVFSAFVL